MDKRTYQRLTLTFLKGKFVKTTRMLRNGVIEIPEGTICEIRDKREGFALRTEPCKCCGVSVFIRKVPYDAVDLEETH